MSATPEYPGTPLVKKPGIAPGGRVWVPWPKKASKVPADKELR